MIKLTAKLILNLRDFLQLIEIEVKTCQNPVVVSMARAEASTKLGPIFFIGPQFMFIKMSSTELKLRFINHGPNIQAVRRNQAWYFLSKSLARWPWTVTRPSLNHVKCSLQKLAFSGFFLQPSATHFSAFRGTTLLGICFSGAGLVLLTFFSDIKDLRLVSTWLIGQVLKKREGKKDLCLGAHEKSMAV